jgi:hypothetical protein
VSDMSKPDWDRYIVDAGGAGKIPLAGKQVPLGDPTRWGSQVVTQLPASFLFSSNSELFTDQLVTARTRDGYSRSWAVIGTLTLPQVIWNGPGPYPGSPFTLMVSLEITMGVGQAELTQEIVLMRGSNPTVGLCNTQSALNGGPYISTFGNADGFDGRFETRGFAAIGALIGNNINIRAHYYGGNGDGLPNPSTIVTIVTPYAPGEGL